MDQFFIKRGDTSPAIRRQFFDGAGRIIDLEGATVVFSMAFPNRGAVVVSRQPCLVQGEADERAVIYPWKPADTAVAGTFRAEFEITFADGAIETVPNGGYLQINIAEDIA